MVVRESPAIEARARKRAQELTAELATIRLGQPCAIDGVLSAIAELTELESVLMYTVRNRTGGWEVGRWNAHGPTALLGPSVATMFESAPGYPFYYNPLKPQPGQRNRVIDALAWIEGSQPGTWDAHPMCVQVLRPHGLHRYHQPRALLCKGPTMLGWFGGLDPAAPTPRQRALLSMFVLPMRDRLDVENRLAEGPCAKRALEAMLDHLAAPAFVVDARGLIHHANLAGRAQLATSNRDLTAAIRAATRGDHRESRFELVPIRDGDAGGWIAIMKTSSPDAHIAACLERSKTRWGLTPRQTEVLGHVTRGASNSTIATLLGCVERTVELHVTAIFDAAGVDSRAALVAAVLTSVS
jgi:DNA-binding CsgD family transcriptional regulator